MLAFLRLLSSTFHEYLYFSLYFVSHVCVDSNHHPFVCAPQRAPQTTFRIFRAPLHVTSVSETLSTLSGSLILSHLQWNDTLSSPKLFIWKFARVRFWWFWSKERSRPFWVSVALWKEGTFSSKIYSPSLN